MDHINTTQNPGQANSANGLEDCTEGSFGKYGDYTEGSFGKYGAGPEYETIARNLKKYRTERNLRQTELARLAGLAQSTVSAIENGRPCELRTIITLCRAMNLPLWMIFLE